MVTPPAFPRSHGYETDWVMTTRWAPTPCGSWLCCLLTLAACAPDPDEPGGETADADDAAGEMEVESDTGVIAADTLVADTGPAPSDNSAADTGRTDTGPPKT